jgi:hypothetical protein
MTLFVSATLLFLVQPMIAKMVLPLLGGTPAVWNTCMVFFQAALLAGYAYAHALTTRLGARRQVIFHTVLLFLPFAVLPISIHGWLPHPDANPIPWLLALLAVSVGLPFFVLSASAPLLQKWFASTGHPSGKDPYFLYAASNLGSMIALPGYVALIEPNLTLTATSWHSQSWLWAAGYGVLVLLMLACARAVWRANRLVEEQAELDPAVLDVEALIDVRPSIWTRLRWIALAFVPSSLLLGVTTHITLDIAAIPLLWIIPLELYLLSFVLVFSRGWPTLVHKGLVLIMPLLILLILFLGLTEIKTGVLFNIALDLVTLLVVALVCHGDLARSRPSTRHLTEFYLLMSLGGVLGGLFNALVAPLIFSSVLEYKVALICACLLVPRFAEGAEFSVGRWILRKLSSWKENPVSEMAQNILTFLESDGKAWQAKVVGLLVDLVLAVSVGIVAFGLVRFFYTNLGNAWLTRRQDDVSSMLLSLSNLIHFEYKRLLLVIVYGLPILICYSFVTRPVRFGLAVAALLVGAAYGESTSGSEVVLRNRSFFGVLTVRHYPADDKYTLLHGTTLHGTQIRGGGHEQEPLTYYHQSGPVGDFFRVFHKRLARQNLGLIGLGSGTLACYGEPGMHLTFYDIDQAVVHIARDSGYFTNLQHCRAEYDIVLGDARLQLEKAPDKHYKLIVVDAFSSDAIPIHLITREALALYFRKLADDGVLAVHISNRYLNLEPVLGNLIVDQGYAGLRRHDDDDDDEIYPGKTSSDWVVLARQPEYLGKLKEEVGWGEVATNPKVGVWTDDYSNLLGVFLWTN